CGRAFVGAIAFTAPQASTCLSFPAARYVTIASPFAVTSSFTPVALRSMSCDAVAAGAAMLATIAPRATSCLVDFTVDPPLGCAFSGAAGPGRRTAGPRHGSVVEEVGRHHQRVRPALEGADRDADADVREVRVEQDGPVLRAAQPHSREQLGRAVRRRRPAQVLADVAAAHAEALDAAGEVAVGEVPTIDHVVRVVPGRPDEPHVE